MPSKPHVTTRADDEASQRRTSPHHDVAWIALASLLAVMPLLVRGTSCGHDLSFHLLNWMETATQWQHGTLRPWWAFHPAFSAGEPRFVFYPPLSWILGAALGLVLPWAATPIAFTFVVLFACGLTMRLLLRAFVQPFTALAGACVYLANPYTLFVAFERTAYAELLAAAWMPLLLLAALRLKLKPLHLACAIALLWLTNAPAAVVGCYSLLCLGVVRVALAARTQGARTALLQAGTMAWATVLGLAASAFYLVPAVAQRRFVQISMAILPGMRPSDSFLFQHTSDPAHDAVLRSASWIAVGTLSVAAGSLAVLLLLRRSPQSYSSMHARGTALVRQAAAERQFAIIATAVLTSGIAFSLTRYSSFLWAHAPELAFLQFPWRFLSIQAAVTVLLACLAFEQMTHAHSSTLQRSPKSVPLMALLCAVVCAASWAAHAAYAQPCDDEDAPSAQRTLYLGATGSPPTDEYTPTDADNDALKPALPEAWLATSADGPSDPSAVFDLIALQDRTSSHMAFQVRAASTGRTLVVRLRRFAGWTVTVDGAVVNPTPERDDGLWSIPLTPYADHQVEVHYRWTTDETAGLLISLGALLTGVLLRWPLTRGKPRKAHAARTSYNQPTA